MCRSTDYHNFISRANNRHLNLRGFFVRLLGLRPNDPLPDSLTLLLLRPGYKSFITLHRVVGSAIFGSRERVRVGEGARFEVYLAGQKALRGGFRREGQDWNLDCKCALQVVGVHVAECEVCVAAEGHVAITERVGMRVVKKMGFVALETIPEDRDEGRESDGRDWEKVDRLDGGDEEEWCDVDLTNKGMEMEQGVGWAVDVGFWVVCLGVGYVVSKSSARTLRRLKIL